MRLLKEENYFFANNDEPVQIMFGLSYSSYLVLSRTLLQSAPIEWQKKFAECFEELELMFGGNIENSNYRVQLLDENSKFIKDPLMNYERGRRRIPLSEKFISELNKGEKE